LLRAAFVCGRISWSVLGLLLRHAASEPRDESGDEFGADAELLDAVQGLTVRELREALRIAAEGDVSAEDRAHNSETEDTRLLQLTIPREDALALTEAETLIRHVDSLGPRGVGLDDCWLEPLLAEGLTTLFDFLPAAAPVMSEEVAERFARRRRVRQQAEARCARAEERAERGLRLAVRSSCDRSSCDRSSCDRSSCEGVETEAMFERELPLGPHAIDAELRALCRELLLVDVAFAGLADRFWRVKGWRALGYASDTQYARERLAMSRSSVRQRIGLRRRVGDGSPLVRALTSGQVGFEAACLVSRVTTGAGWVGGDDLAASDVAADALASDAAASAAADALGSDVLAAAWVQRAQARTYKHLRQEVAAVQLLARLEGRSLLAGPPTVEELERVRSMERIAKSGDAAWAAAMDVEGHVARPVAVVQMSVTLPLQLSRRLNVSATSEPVQLSKGGLLGCTTVRLRVSEDVALLFRQVEAAYARSGLPGRFVPFLVSALFQSFGELLGDRSKWEAIHRRDGYECSCPVCERQDVTLHHVTYRSHGGGDDPENVLSLCSFCHLDGEHGGRLRVRGDASEPVWMLGPPNAPVLIVHGRERVAA